MTTEIVKLETQELSLIEKSKAEQIKKTFEPMVKMLEGFEEDYHKILKEAESEITIDITSQAKRLRLDIGKVRIETGKIKDKQKEYIKLEDRAIMGVHNILVWAVKEKEDKLKEIEKHFELQEQERLQKLQSQRVSELSKYVDYQIDIDLASMEEEVFNAYLNSKKQEYLDRIAAEKKAEEERIAKEKAEKEEQERIKKENEALKKEALEKERFAKIEQEKRNKEEKERKEKEEAERLAREKIEAERLAKEEAKRKAREAKEKKEREKLEAKIKAEQEEKARIQKEERLKREKLEAELKAKEEAERKAKEEEEARIQTELNKGDKEKVKDLIANLEALKTKYSFKSSKNKEMYRNFALGIDNFINNIKRGDLF